MTPAPDPDPPAQASQPLAYQTWLASLRDNAQQRRATFAQRDLHIRDGTGKFIEHRSTDGRPRRLLNLAGNDYLALAGHPRLRDAAIAATQRFGTGATASRLVTGTLSPHAALERRFADFKHADAALLFPTGTAANLAVLTTLARPGDLVCQDKLNHACLIDGARYSGATVRTFPHRNYNKLERLLQTVAEKRIPDATNQSPRTFVTTDAVFSMDGTTADLPRLLELCDHYGAILIVDEAHGTGVLGPTGSGLAEHQGVAGQIPVTVSTASKALAGLGGIVTADAAVIDELINRARGFIYTTAPPAAIPAAIDAALDVLQDEPDRGQRLAEIIHRIRAGLREAGWPIHDDPTPIVPLTVGTNQAALDLAEKLERAGFLAVAIRPPTVPPGSARVRLSLRADLADDECDALLHALGSPPHLG